MKNVTVYTVDASDAPHWKRAESITTARQYINFQIENCIRVGWSKQDIVCITNFPHEYMSVRCLELPQDMFYGFIGSCACKHIGAMHALEMFQQPIYLHDHDCFQWNIFDGLDIIKHWDFVCCRTSVKHPLRISDQSCFLSPKIIPTIQSFIQRYATYDKSIGFGFKFGRHVIQNCSNISTPFKTEFPYRFNMMDPNWETDLRKLISFPKVVHEKLNQPHVISFLKQHGVEAALSLYLKHSTQHLEHVV